MPTLEDLRRRLDAIEGLQSIVRTMKTLASVNVRQYDEATTALADYARTVEQGLQIALRASPDPPVAAALAPARRLGAIVFGSDQGMCGQFNDRIADHVVQSLAQTPADRCFVMAAGRRVGAALERAGRPVEQACSVPGSVAGITPLVHQLLASIEQWRSQHDIDHLTLFYHRYGRTSFEPHTLRLLPLDMDWLAELHRRPWPSRSLPTFTMDREALFSALIRQYLFVGLYRAAAESLASENASRLQSMQAAEKNIEDRLTDLNAHYHRERQDAITAELLDVVAGSEALAE